MDQVLRPGPDSPGPPSCRVYNPDLPTILPFYLTEYSTDVSQWRRNPYYWKVDPAGNQLPYMERIVVTNVEDLEVWNGKTLAGEYTMSGFLTSVEDFGLFKENEETGDYRVINWPTAFAAAANYQPNLTAADADLRPGVPGRALPARPVAGDQP